jgi:glutaredoxin 3
MDSKNIEYTDVDVSKDQAAAIKMVELSGQMGVPVIDIDGDITVGFYKPAFEAKLQDRGLI